MLRMITGALCWLRSQVSFFMGAEYLPCRLFNCLFNTSSELPIFLYKLREKTVFLFLLTHNFSEHYQNIYSKNTT